MEPEELRKYMKRLAMGGSFFLLALLFYFLGWRKVLTVYAVASAILLVGAILLQSGRGGGLASLGGLDTDALLGTRSATPIAKATYILGALFIFCCMLVARLGLVRPRATSAPPRNRGRGKRRLTPGPKRRRRRRMSAQNPRLGRNPSAKEIHKQNDKKHDGLRAGGKRLGALARQGGSQVGQSPGFACYI